MHFPFPNVDLGITVVSVLQNTRNPLNIGDGEGHIWVRTKVWRENVRNFQQNSREMVTVTQAVCVIYSIMYLVPKGTALIMPVCISSWWAQNITLLKALHSMNGWNKTWRMSTAPSPPGWSWQVTEQCTQARWSKVSIYLKEHRALTYFLVFWSSGSYLGRGAQLKLPIYKCLIISFLKLLLLLLLLNSEFCQGPVHFKRTLIKNTSFSGSQLSRLLEVMDARKNRACEEDSRISVGRPFFFCILRSSTCSAGYFSCNRLRVRIGHGKPGRSLKFLFGRLVTAGDKARIT